MGRRLHAMIVKDQRKAKKELSVLLTSANVKAKSVVKRKGKVEKERNKF